MIDRKAKAAGMARSGPVVHKAVKYIKNTQKT